MDKLGSGICFCIGSIVASEASAVGVYYRVESNLHESLARLASVTFKATFSVHCSTELTINSHTAHGVSCMTESKSVLSCLFSNVGIVCGGGSTVTSCARLTGSEASDGGLGSSGAASRGDF